MSNTVIRLKKSSVPGDIPSSLEHGEIAINYADGKLYYKDPANSIQQISSGNSFATINASGTIIIADLQNDVLSFQAGENIQISGDYINDAITITANLKAAFDVANSAFAAANDVAPQIAPVYNLTNAAFNKANSAYDLASNVAPQVKPAFDTANAAFAAANLASVATANVGNTAPSGVAPGSLWWDTVLGRLFIYYNDGDSSQWVETTPAGTGLGGGGGGSSNLIPIYTYANGIYDLANAAFNRANTSNDVLFIVSAFDVANAAFDSANNVSPQIAPARDTANAAFDKANSANVLAYNTGIGANNYAGAMANAANAYAASLTPDLSPVFIVANSAFDKANAANVLAYETGIGANAYINVSAQSANNYAGAMANAANDFAYAGYTNVSFILSNNIANNAVSANNYAGEMANAANGYAETIVAANLVTSRAYTNTSTEAANNYSGAMANSVNAYTSATYSTLTQLGDNWAVTNAAFGLSNNVYAAVNSAFGVINTTYTVANAAFDRANAGGANVGQTAPAGATSGRLWWNSDLGKMFIYYTDPANTSSWVETSPSASVIEASIITGYINPVSAVANIAFDTANAAFASANNVAPQVAPSFNTANAAFATANAAYGRANTALQNTNVTLAGNLTSTGAITLNRFPFYESTANIDFDYTINTGMNAMTPGPITVANGVTVTVPAGSTWTVV